MMKELDSFNKMIEKAPKLLADGIVEPNIDKSTANLTESEIALCTKEGMDKEVFAKKKQEMFKG